MADFVVFSGSGTNLLSSATFESDTDIVNGFQPNTVARSVAINSYLKALGVICSSLSKQYLVEENNEDITSATDLSNIQPIIMGSIKTGSQGNALVYTDQGHSITKLMTISFDAAMYNYSNSIVGKDSFDLTYTRKTQYTNSIVGATSNYDVDAYINNELFSMTFTVPTGATVDIIFNINIKPFHFATSGGGLITAKYLVDMKASMYIENTGDMVDTKSFIRVYSVTGASSIPLTILLDHQVAYNQSTPIIEDSLVGNAIDPSLISRSYSNRS